MVVWVPDPSGRSNGEELVFVPAESRTPIPQSFHPYPSHYTH